jgi:tetratricopeptide (TPR) repeat protein
MPAPDRPPWLVRIQRTAQPGVGGGVLIGERHVLTCAHVAGVGAAEPSAPVLVRFPFLDAHEPIPAVVVPGGWHPGPARDTTRADVAILELRGEPPAGAEPAPLRSIEGDPTEQLFRTYGFPDGHTAVGVPALGKVIGSAGRERLAVMSHSDRGHAMGPGFSGSPVWDDGGVLGIMVARDKVLRDQVDQRTAYVIPNSVLAGYWPDLAHLIDRSGALGHRRDLLENILDLPLPADGLLPRVTDVEMYDIGVSPAKPTGGDPARRPYSPRRVDAELSEALGRERFIVLIGDSKSGKSRTMLELLRRDRPRARLLVPRAGPPGLAALRKLSFPDAGDQVVIWLDDLDLFLGPHGIDLKVLSNLRDRGRDTLVVGTIKTKRYEDLRRTEGEVGRTARLVLGRAREVWLERLLGDDERREARKLYPDEDFAEWGIGEQMVAAPELERLYRAAPGTDPLAWAILQATVDWRRIGMDRPIPPDVLRDLSYRYALSTGLAGPDDFEASLRWVMQEVAGSIALVRRIERRGVVGYEAFDYVVALADGQGAAGGQPIEAYAWDTAAEIGAPMELLGVAFALLTRGDLPRAREAADRAHRTATDEMTRIWAAQLLGELTFAEGDAQAARDLFYEVIDGPAPEVASFARLNLGVVLLTLGEWEAARPMLEAVLDTEHPELTALAKAQLGGLILTEQGQEQTAVPGQVRGPGDISTIGDFLNGERMAQARRQLVPLAQINLSNLLMNRGELGRAQALLEEALTSNSAEVVPLAKANLGSLLVNVGDEERGRALLTEAAESADLNARLAARTTLGWLAAQAGDQELLAEVAGTGFPEHAARAADLLGDVRVASGDLDGAREAYRRAMATGHSFWAPVAAIDLATLEAQAGHIEAARELLTEVTRDANRELALRATDLLGDQYHWQGDLEAAAAAYREVIEADHPYWSAIARIDLGMLLASDEDHDGALREIEPAARSANPTIAAGAHLYLGLIRASRGDAAPAREHFARAAESPNPSVALAAQFNTAKLAAEAGDIDEAVAFTREVLAGCEREDPASVPVVRGYLSAMLLRRGDLDEAIPLLSEGDETGEYEQAFLAEGESLFVAGEVDAAGDLLATAVGSADPPTAARARLYLGQVRLAQGRFAEAEDLLRSALDGANPAIEPAARRYLGSALARQGRNEQARQMLLPFARRAAETGVPDEDGAATLHLLGQLEALEGRTEEAASLLRDALSIADDEDLRVHLGLELGELLVSGGDVAAGTELLIPLTAVPGDLGRRAAAILSRAADEPPQLPTGPAPDAPPPASIEEPEPPAAEPAAPSVVAALPPLPARIRYLLGEVALAEGEPEEADDWFRSVRDDPGARPGDATLR